MAPKKQSTQPVVAEQTPVAPTPVAPTPVVVQTTSAPSTEPVAKKVTKRGKSAEKVDVAPAPEPVVVQQTIAPIIVASETPVIAEKKPRAKKQAVVATESAPVVVAPVVTEQPKVEVAQTKKGGKKAKADVSQSTPVVETKQPEPVAVASAPSTEAEKPKRGKGKKGVDIVVDMQPVVSTPVSVASQPVAETEKKTGGRKKKTAEPVVEAQVAPSQPIVQQVVETVAEKPAKTPRAKKVKAKVVAEPQVAVLPAPVVVEQNAEAVAPPKKGKTYFKLEYADGEVGRYSSKSHKASASSSKAFNKLLRLKRKSGQSDAEILNVEHEFTIRECNRMKGNDKSKHKFIGISKRLPEPVGVPIGKENIQLRDATGKPLRDADGKLVKEKKELIVHQQGPNKEFLFNADGTPKMGKKLIYHFYENKVKKAPKPPVVLSEKQIQRREARQAKLAQQTQTQQAPASA